MKCTISRLPDDVAIQLDDQGMYNPEFEELYTDIPCFIMYLRLAAGKFLVKESGQDSSNEIICLLDCDQDIKVGDRLDCETFYPNEFYVDSINPITNARNGIIHHFECIMSLEKKN